MLLVTLAVVLASQLVVDGNQRIVYVSQSISDNEEFFTSGDNDRDVDSNLMCCVYGNCSCNSLDHALVNLTSNVLINITTNVMLSLHINASNLENVSVIGHNNPTVNCTNAGRIDFNFCYNCIIQDITWDGCGRETEAGIKVGDSSNIVIENCSFQNSKGPAIVLSGVSGHVNISHSNFVHNNHYGGHGAAIHYSTSNVTNDLQLFLTISNCNFTNNKNAKSLVYIQNVLSKYNNNITFQNSKFCHNQGISAVYVVNQKIIFVEKVLFQNNTAENGAGIYVKDHSTVIFGKNSDVTFIQGFADYNGGAIFLRSHSRIIFGHNSMVIFNNNTATSGIIYSEVNCNVTFQETCEVTFSSNLAKGRGSAIYSSDNCHITFTESSKVTFINNEVGSRRNRHYNNYGTIYSIYSSVSFKENSTTQFVNNTAYDGGSIYSNDGSISFEENSITQFTNNTAASRGGAINSKDSSISFEENSITQFTNNTAAHNGGAIFSYDGSLFFEGNSTTQFTKNTAAYYGGAIYSYDGSISFNKNSTTQFTNSTAAELGGAIYSYDGSISFKENSTTQFTNNIAMIVGGAIRSFESSIAFEENSTTQFTNNTAAYNGGAINSKDSSISFEENSITQFTNNTAAYRGGAIFSYDGSLFFEGNSTTQFTNNTAAYHGGAIYSTGGSISFDENSTTQFTNSTAADLGGAIYSYDGSISFKENSTTQFTNNTALKGGAIYSIDASISFEENSTTQFTNNIAMTFGGAIRSFESSIAFEENSTTQFTNNTAAYYGGAIYSTNGSISFKGNTITEFTNNTASTGGAIRSRGSSVCFGSISNTKFNNNVAKDDGGAIYFSNLEISYYYIQFNDNSHVEFNNNTATKGGAIYSINHIPYNLLLFNNNSHIKFNNNTATRGGAIYSINSFISFEGFSATVFSNNIAKDYGGALIAEDESEITFCNNSKVTFTHNSAPFSATVYCGRNCHVTTKDNSTVTFNNVLAKWCTNTCTPYIGEGAVTIDSNGIVRCSDQKAFECLSENYNCKNLEHLLHNLTEGTSNVVVNIADKAILSKTVQLEFLTNVSIIGESNFTVLCVDDCKLTILDCNNFTIQGITWIGSGGYPQEAADSNNLGYIYANPVMVVRASSILVQKNTFQNLQGAAIEIKDSDSIIAQCNFMNNNYYTGHGAALTTTSYLHINSNGTQIINNCDFSYNGGVIGIVFLEAAYHVSMSNITFCNNQGVSIYLSWSSLHISGDILLKNNAAENGAGIYISDHSSILFDDNSTVKFINNSVDHSGSAIFMNSHSSVTFQRNSIVTFYDNKGITGTIYSRENSNITFNANSRAIFNNNSVTQYGAAIYLLPNCLLHISGGIFFKNNRAGNGAGIYVSDYSAVIFGEKSYVEFINNSVDHNGSAIFMNSNSSVTFEHSSIATFYDNKGISGTIYSEDNSKITFEATSQVIFNNNSVTQYGAAIYLLPNYFLHIGGDIFFKNNRAGNGAGIYISDYSAVIFGEKSYVEFINNSVDYSGSAIFMNSHSNVIFEQNSIVIFYDNRGIRGTIYSVDNSNITFEANSQVTFNNNLVTQYGAAIYSFDNSHVTFTGSSNVTFTNNIVSTNQRSKDFGGIIFSSNYSHTSFDGNSTILFSNNSANVGAAIFAFYKSSITFKDKSKVMFNRNVAQRCGILTSVLFSNITFIDNTEVTFNHNSLSCASTSNYESSAGAMCTSERTNVMFAGHSLVVFINNSAEKGGTVLFSHSNVTIEEYSAVTFNGNVAEYSNGGAFVCFNNSIVTIRGNSNITFNNNKASQSGGAIHSYYMCKIIFEDNSTSSFIKNTATDHGGAILSDQLSDITFEGNSTITFDGNMANNGGAFYFTNSTITLNNKSKISFHNNKALYGGAISANDQCNITETGNSVLLFVNNEASQSGGAGYFSSYCNITIEEDAMVTFHNNRALQGGAVCFSNKSNILSTENSTVFFYNNLATVGGGAATVLTNSTFTLQGNVTTNFSNNHARYGAAIFLDDSAVMINSSNKNSLNFKNNIARIAGNSLYQGVADLCNRSCLTDQVLGVNTDFIATPPNELKFYDPAICIDSDNDTQCNSYYVQNIMLGSDIVIPSCVRDYYNHSIEPTQFLVQSEYNSSYTISGPGQVLVGCNLFEGISIIGSEVLSKSTNLSVSVNLNVDHNADWKPISVTLIVEVSECHPGFWHSSKSQKCECYNANNIVFCSGSSSTIRRGYWFGSVTEKPTVTFCPINYCNFTCCETSNGYYHLSPVRNNQCRSHRSGTACGSCEYGYTLPFDSTECVSVSSCTAGKTVLVILLTVTYWIAMVILVFAIMYYRVGIGYLYCITYYYSIVDILLSQSLQASRGLYLTVSIISSFSKITPQFLGELCLATDMSGIDQQFIHYIHPSAVVLIIVIISLLARKSQRFAEFISRGIIHVICLLLLLSYTSIASTSLLLMRSLKFHEIDEVYTYLSPGIEYFHGRHLAYGIIALLCSVFIVSMLPLLLTLQPILKHKMNFIKIKPLLDQFQGCYKGNYHCFAGYYMICRLVIMIIVIANSSNDSTINYVLIVACGIIALIHVMVKPYNNEILNKFDAVILFLIIFIAAVPVIDDFDAPLVITLTFVLMILPLMIFITLSLFLHKDDLKKMFTNFIFKNQASYNTCQVTSNNVAMKEFDHIIDDDARKNATVTICDM